MQILKSGESSEEFKPVIRDVQHNWRHLLAYLGLILFGLFHGAEIIYRFSLWVFDDKWLLGVNHAYVEPVWNSSWILVICGIAGVLIGWKLKWKLGFVLIMAAYIGVGLLGIWMIKIGGFVDYYDYIQGVYPSR